MTDAELDAALGIVKPAKGKKGAAVVVAPVPVAASPQDAELDAALGITPAAPAADPPAVPAQTTVADAMRRRLLDPAEAGALSAGFRQAGNNIALGVNRLASWADQRVPFLGRLDAAAGLDPTANANALTAGRDQFNQTYGGSGPAQFGMMAGQTALTAPVTAVLNPLLARGVGAAGEALGGIAPTAGRWIQGAGNIMGGGAGMPTATEYGSFPLRVLSQGVSGALQGGEASLLNSGQSDAPVSDQVRQGAIAGGGMGAAIPVAARVGNALSGAAARIPQDIAELAQLARDRYGIQMSAPDLSGGSLLKYANNALRMVPGSGATADNAAVQAQFNRALSRTFGEDAPKITPAVLNSAQKRIGGTMETIEKGAQVQFGNGFINDIANIESNARSSLTDQEFGVVRRQLDNLLTNLQPNGAISGTTYGNLIHKGAPLDAALNSSNPNIAHYAGQIKEALRDSLTASLPPAEAAAYQQARTQYKNLKTVEPLTLRADSTGGAMPSTGDISPAALRAAVNRSFGTGVAQAAPGSVPLADLARIGQLLKEPPSSGTAERGSLLYAGAKGAQLLGALGTGYLMPSQALSATAALGAGMAGGRAANMYLRSPALANRMIGASLNPLSTAQNPLALQTLPALSALMAQHPELFSPPKN